MALSKEPRADAESRVLAGPVNPGGLEYEPTHWALWTGPVWWFRFREILTGQGKLAVRSNRRRGDRLDDPTLALYTLTF